MKIILALLCALAFAAHAQTFTTSNAAAFFSQPTPDRLTLTMLQTGLVPLTQYAQTVRGITFRTSPGAIIALLPTANAEGMANCTTQSGACFFSHPIPASNNAWGWHLSSIGADYTFAAPTNHTLATGRIVGPSDVWLPQRNPYLTGLTSWTFATNGPLTVSHVTIEVEP